MQIKKHDDVDSNFLLNSCKNKHQIDIVNQYIKNKKNISKTAERLGVTYDTVQKVIERVRKNVVENKDIKKIIDKDFDIDVNATSTLYDSEGNIINKWVKKNNSKNNLKILIDKFIKEYSSKLPKYVSEKNSNSTYEDNLIVYPIVDIHLGMLSLLEETGTEWNLKEADKLIRTCISKLISRSPRCKECLICNLGDYFHVDNVFNKTPTNGNFLDVDGRYSKILNIGVKLIRYIIEYATTKHKNITVINCIGNHDLCGSMWLNAALQHIYEDNKNIHIINNSSPRQYYKYGNTLIGMTHGMDCSFRELPLVMASEKSKEWGQTKFHYWYTGHIHQDKKSEFPGCIVESFKTIAGKDAWTNSKGYLSYRGVSCIVIDPKNGESERYNINLI